MSVAIRGEGHQSSSEQTLTAVSCSVRKLLPFFSLVYLDVRKFGIVRNSGYKVLQLECDVLMFCKSLLYIKVFFLFAAVNATVFT